MGNWAHPPFPPHRLALRLRSGWRGTARRVVEGHALVILTFWRGDTLNVPLHQLRWSPSPSRGELIQAGANSILPIDLPFDCAQDGGGPPEGWWRGQHRQMPLRQSPLSRQLPPPHRKSMGEEFNPAFALISASSPLPLKGGRVTTPSPYPP
jgi:hypothetical protein